MQLERYDDLEMARLTVTFGVQKMHVNVFSIDGLLIDTGPMKKKAEMNDLLRRWDVEQVVITHHHEDHTGLAKYIQDQCHLPIYMHEKGVQLCEGKLNIPFYRKTFWGVNEPFQAEPISQQIRTKQYTWDVIHTPGHADDHIVLYNREKKWLFGGDLYVSSRPKSMFAFESFQPTVESLKRMLELDFDVYFCSHIGILENGRQLIQEKLDYLLHLEKEIIKLDAEGYTPRDIRKMLLPKRHKMHYLTFFENSPMHLIHSVLQANKVTK